MLTPFDVLVRPIVSEKSNRLRESGAVYCFQVQLAANKKDIAQAVNKMFDVKVKHVKTLVCSRKSKRRGSQMVRTKKSKKAFVTLQEGQKIKIFEEA